MLKEFLNWLANLDFNQLEAQADALADNSDLLDAPILFEGTESIFEKAKALKDVTPQQVNELFGNAANEEEEEKEKQVLLKIETIIELLELNLDSLQESYRNTSYDERYEASKINEEMDKHVELMSRLNQLRDLIEESKPKPIPTEQFQDIQVKPFSANDLMTAQVETKKAEEKVAQGVSDIYKLVVANKQHDRQGVDTIELSEEDVNRFKHYFPLGLTHGMVVHVYSKNALYHPPVVYMAKQKIKSLCDAAVSLGMAKEVAEQIEKELITQFEEKFEAISVADLDIFHKASTLLLEENANQVFLRLYEESETALSKEEYAKEIKKSSEKVRTNHQAILTFDKGSNRFSLDEIAPNTVSSHHRYAFEPTANLGIVYEGEMDDKGVARVVTHIVHHASLPPLNVGDSNGTPQIHATPYEQSLTKHIHKSFLFIATCKHIKEVATLMATLRAHGRDLDGKDMPININWVYQLLTSNAFNVDKQQASYEFIVEAMSFMNGASFATKGNDGREININLRAQVFNAGINAVGKLDKATISLRESLQSIGVAPAMQALENRKAYIQLSDALNDAFLDLQDDPLLVRFRALLLPKIAEKLMKDYQEQNDLQHKNAMAFNLLCKDELNDDEEETQTKPDLTEKLMDLRRNGNVINNNLQTISSRINNERKAHHEKNKQLINELRDEVREQLANQKSEALAQLEKRFLVYSACFYKSYMDELYYSGSHLEPKQAVLFNAYLAAYQRLMGMTASVGCKSGNDRTYVLRLVLAAIEGRPLDECLLPPNCHVSNDENKKTLIELIKPVARANSGVYNTIIDTGGGTPKVSSSLYKILKGVTGIEFLKKMGNLATHIFKLMPSKPNYPVRGLMIGGTLGGLSVIATLLIASGVGAPLGVTILSFVGITAILSELVASAIVAAAVFTLSSIVGVVLGAIKDAVSNPEPVREMVGEEEDDVVELESLEAPHSEEKSTRLNPANIAKGLEVGITSLRKRQALVVDDSSEDEPVPLGDDVRPVQQEDDGVLLIDRKNYTPRGTVSSV